LQVTDPFSLGLQLSGKPSSTINKKDKQMRQPIKIETFEDSILIKKLNTPENKVFKKEVGQQ
jgi:hypothetical protein